MRQVQQEVQGLTQQWLDAVDAMQVLCEQSRMVQPRYFYVEVVRHVDRCAVFLRWRSCGRNGTSLRFDDARLQAVLVQLPVSLRRQYARWEQEKEFLNSQVRKLRLAFGDRTSNERLKQKLLDF